MIMRSWTPGQFTTSRRASNESGLPGAGQSREILAGFLVFGRFVGTTGNVVATERS